MNCYYFVYQICVTAKRNTISSIFVMQEPWLCFIKTGHLRNIAVNLIYQVCHEVRIELPLQTLTGETFDSRSTNMIDQASLDISFRGF